MDVTCCVRGRLSDIVDRQLSRVSAGPQQPG